MGLTRILAVYCTGPLMVGVEMEAEGALLELFPHEAEGEVKAGRQKSHALYAFQRHHAARHGGHALVLATSSPDCHTSGASKLDFIHYADLS
jgi:hypothetical protein